MNNLNMNGPTMNSQGMNSPGMSNLLQRFFNPAGIALRLAVRAPRRCPPQFGFQPVPVF